MAPQFCDGFDSYAVQSDIVGKWGGVRYTTSGDVAFVSGAGRFGGGAARLTSTNGALVRKTAPTTDELFVWLAAFPRSYPTANVSLLLFEDATGNAAVLRVNTGGAVYGSQMGTTAAVTPTSPQSFALGEWNTLAVHYKCADSGGRWRVILNGVEQFDFTGDTRLSGGTAIDRLAIGGIRSGAGNEWDIDDVVLCDATGGYMNALLTGDLKIETLRPIGDNGSGGWTPSTGTDHAALIDDVGPNDADFLTATAAGTRDLFTLADPAAAPLLTHALVVNARARRTDTAARALRPLVRVNAADDLSPDRTLSNQFAVLQHPVYRNPDGAAAWTGAALNAALIGVEAGS